MTTTTAALAPTAGHRLAPAILMATAVSGLLDISDAVIWALAHGKSPAKMLQWIASALLGKGALDGGLATAALGLGMHFAIMAAMVSVFVLAASRMPALTRRPILWGVLYGVGLYLVMNWVVLPLRWPAAWGAAKPLSVANQIFANLVLVGIPMSLITAHFLKPRTP